MREGGREGKKREDMMEGGRTEGKKELFVCEVFVYMVCTMLTTAFENCLDILKADLGMYYNLTRHF